MTATGVGLARRLAAVVLALGLLAGCGDEDPISDAAGTVLASSAADLRAAAAARDEAAFRKALEVARDLVDDLVGRGEVGADRAGDLRAALDDIEDAIPAITTTTTTEPPRGKDDDDDDDNKGKGRPND